MAREGNQITTARGSLFDRSSPSSIKTKCRITKRMNQTQVETKPIQKSEHVVKDAQTDVSRPFYEGQTSRFLIIVLELALVLTTIYLFQLERDHGLLRILPSLFFGFIVYYLLPRRLRLPFLFLL